MAGNIAEVSDATFEEKVLKAKGPVVVDFWAPWCGPCRVVSPELEKLSEEVGDKATFVKVNVDDNQATAARYGIMSIPTIARFENGELVKQVIGARGKDELKKELDLE